MLDNLGTNVPVPRHPRQRPELPSTGRAPDNRPDDNRSTGNRSTDDRGIDLCAGAALSGRRVLVTGARGFIGRHLVRHLLDVGAEVHALIRPGSPAPRAVGLAARLRVRWRGCDLRDPEAVGEAFTATRPHAVFHLASRVQGHRGTELVLPMLEDNTRVAINVMGAALSHGAPPVVLAGSVEEPHHGEVPPSPYAAAKAAATGYAQLFHAQWDLPVAVLRMAMVYGPGQDDRSKLLPHLLDSMLEGRTPRLSSGTREIDWVFVDDVCRAFLLAATREDAAGLVADIGSGTATSIADTATLVAQLAGYDGDLGFGAAPDRRQDAAFIADLAEAADRLGWQPRTSLADGLTRTVEWHRTRLDVERRGLDPSLSVPDRDSGSVAMYGWR